MPITNEWINDEQQILLQTFSGAWTWQEFIQAGIGPGGTVERMESVDHRVHVISDFTPSAPLPVGAAMTQAGTVIRRYPANWGILVVVAPSLFIRTMVNAFRRTFHASLGQHTYAASTLEEAYDIIERWEQHRLTIQPVGLDE